MDSYARTVLNRLSKKYGYNIHTQLSNKNMRELFVAVLLSPQTTDTQTNRVTPALFARYRSFEDYADADIKELMRYLSGVNYYKTKARHLKRAARIIVDRFDSRVPKTLAELMELPGVGRKVGNVILNEGYGIDEGIAVDTHCGRVARRLWPGFKNDPKKIEFALMKKYDKDQWGRVSNTFIELGRDACRPKRECYRCVLKDICPSSLEKKRQ